jgi:anthranilate phosphoribosyltransferase
VSGDTLVAELKDGDVREYTVHPREFGIRTASLSEIQVGDPAASKQMLLAALSNKPGAARDVVALNAGAAIYAADLAESHEDGVRKALEIIASGAAKARLDEFVAFTNKFKT